MTSKKLNNLLIKEFPNLINKYNEEVEWQEGDDTGSHIVYGDVFTPYMVRCIEDNKKDELNKIFNYIELILEKEDKYIDEVIAFSVLEGVVDLIKEDIFSMLGIKTQEILAELYLT